MFFKVIIICRWLSWIGKTVPEGNGIKWISKNHLDFFWVIFKPQLARFRGLNISIFTARPRRCCDIGFIWWLFFNSSTFNTSRAKVYRPDLYVSHVCRMWLIPYANLFHIGAMADTYQPRVLLDHFGMRSYIQTSIKSISFCDLVHKTL